MKEIIVKRQTETKRKRWGVYQDGVLVEGGFFSKDSAEVCAAELRDALTFGADSHPEHC